MTQNEIDEQFAKVDAAMAKLQASLERAVETSKELRKALNPSPPRPRSNEPYTANGTLWGHNET